MSIFTNFKDIKFLIAKSCGNDYKRLKMKSWPNIALRSPKYLYTNTSNNTLKVRNVLEQAKNAYHKPAHTNFLKILQTQKYLAIKVVQVGKTECHATLIG